MLLGGWGEGKTKRAGELSPVRSIFSFDWWDREPLRRKEF